MGTRRLRLPALLPLLAASAGLAAAPSGISVCVDYGCDVTRQASLTRAEWQTVASLFSPTGDAEDERAAIARAVGELETLVGNRTGTAGDAPRNSARDGGIGQLDCIAESLNTQTYLDLLGAEGLLRHHRPAPREVRHLWLVRTHWTAVIKETATGSRYAVDSWYGANGEPAAVQPLAAWHDGLPVDAR